MSMPFEASVNGASTLPFTGHIQSTSSRSVPLLSGSTLADGAGAGAGTGVVGVGGGVVPGVGPGPGAGTGAGTGAGDAAPASAFNCASARSEYGIFCPRGSTFAVGVFASGRASIGGPGVASGVATGPGGGFAPAGA